MTRHLLSGTLEHLAEAFAHQRSAAEVELQQTEIELAEIQAALSDLEARRQTCQLMLERRTGRLQELASEFDVAQVQAVLAALHASLGQIDRLQQAAQHLADLDAQRRWVLERQPELAQHWQEFREIVDFFRKPHALESLPPTLRALALQAKETAEQRVAPILEVETRARERLAEAAATLEILITRETADSSRMLWIMPVFHHLLEAGPNRHPAAWELLRAADNAVVELARAPDWVVQTATRQKLGDLVALEVEALYVSSQPQPETVIANILRQQLEASPLLQIVKPDLHVVAVPWPVWQGAEAGLSQLTVQLASAKPEATIPASAEPPSLANLLFAAADLRAWSAKVATGSEWGTPARRLRTLFMRLLSNGYVGDNGLEAHLIWQDLPETHATVFQQVLPQLIEAALLRRVGSSNLVAINSERLPDVQALINRDITPAWGAVLLS